MLELHGGGGGVPPATHRRVNLTKSVTRNVVLSTIVILATLQGAVARGTYSVVAPSVLRPNRDFSVVVSAHETEAPLQLAVEITGNLQGGGSSALSSFQTRQETVVQSDSSQLVKFQMGDLNPGDYYLSVSGTSTLPDGSVGLQIRNITSLKFNPKSYSIFIETDRGAYKPGDTVQFRVIVVNPDLRPSVTGAIDVTIMDGGGTAIKQYPRVFTNKGVWTEQLLLSKEPVLGNWTISVSVLGQRQTATFFVAEFQEPKFDVSVHLPDYLSLEDLYLPVTVEASTSEGRPIAGEVTVQVTPQYNHNYLQAPYTPPVSVVRPIKGTSDMLLHMEDDLGLRGDYSRVLHVTAYVKEYLTDRVQNSTSVVTVYRYPYKMTFIRSSDTFKPGLKYTAYLKVTYQDGTPVESSDVVTLRHAFSGDSSGFITSLHRVPPSGVVTLEVLPPLQGATTLALEAHYKNLTQWLGEVPRAYSPSKSYVQATILTEHPQVGGEVVVTLNSTTRLVYFVYELLARGDVVHATTLQAHQGDSHTFRFVASGTMFPRARLVVYYVRPDGEVVADSLHFAVARGRRDRVSLSVAPAAVDITSGGQGSRVSVTVAAKPNSLVGVAAMDSSGLSIMGPGYRLDQEDVVSELETYDSGSDWQLPTSQGRQLLDSWHSTSSAYDVFENAGVVVMTNARVPQQDPITRGTFLSGSGPIDGRGFDPSRQPPAHNGPFGRAPSGNSAATVKPDLGPGVEYNAPPRPPLAGPYAFSFLPPPPDHKPRLHLSRSLPPTWLWTHRQTGLNGILTWQETAPDTLANYTLTAFAIDDFDGLIIADDQPKVRTYRPFFVSISLPPSIVLGEAVAAEVVLHSNLENEVPSSQGNLTVEVKLHNPDGEFLFPDFSNELEQSSPAAELVRILEVSPSSRVPLSFMILPQKLGPLSISVTATASPSQRTYTAVKTLQVRPKGTRLYVNKAVFIDTKAEPSFSRVLNVSLPRNIVNDSLKIEVSAMGDLLGEAITSLEALVLLPRGCGEQNMAATIPILLSLQHLRSAGELSRTYEERAKQQLELRFQQQLTYMQPDGSFAFFDEYRSTQSSTWLTAFVAKTMRMMSDVIAVPRHVITDALAWLVKQQRGDGSFAEVDDMRNTSNSRQSPIALTAYVLLAILEVEDYSSPAVRNAGNRALEYLSAVLKQAGDSGDVDTYGLAVTCYAMHVANHPYKDTAFYMLEAEAVVTDGLKWWPSSDESATSTEEGDIVSATTIEQTSYALLTYARRSLAVDSTGVTAWLTARRNVRGGFTTSQDTAVGLSALSAISQLLSVVAGRGAEGPTSIRVVYGERGHRFLVNAGNARTVQKLEVPSDTRSIEVSASGGGQLAILQLSYSYNVQVTAPRPAFSLDPQLDRTTDSNKLRLTACTAPLATIPNNTNIISDMVVMEVRLPSGYVVDNDALPGLYDYPGVRRVERLQSTPEYQPEDGVAIYFQRLGTAEVCPTITASRVYRVAFQKPTAVKVYDYYDLTRQARQFYDALPATLCDICDLGECDETACDTQIIELNRQRQAYEDIGYPAVVEETSTASRTFTNGLCLVTLPIITFIQLRLQ